MNLDAIHVNIQNNILSSQLSGITPAFGTEGAGFDSRSPVIEWVQASVKIQAPARPRPRLKVGRGFSNIFT